MWRWQWRHGRNACIGRNIVAPTSYSVTGPNDANNVSNNWYWYLAAWCLRFAASLVARFQGNVSEECDAGADCRGHVPPQKEGSWSTPTRWVLNKDLMHPTLSMRTDHQQVVMGRDSAFLLHQAGRRLQGFALFPDDFSQAELKASTSTSP